MPVVTVYIVNHNYGRFLEESINSVLKQSFKDFELIIVDDGSTDNSDEVLKKYEFQNRIKVVRQKNKGLNITNNIALKISSGKYIIRLDADDFFADNALSILVKELESNSDYALVFPDYYEISESGKILHRIKRNDFKKDVTLLDLPAHGACTMIRKDVLREIGGYDESFNRQDGYDIWLKIIHKHKISNVNEPLFFYRQHSKSLTSNKSKLLETRAKILEKHVDRMNISALRVLAIIPIRGQEIDSRSRPLEKIKGKELVFWTVDEAVNCEAINKVIVSTPDKILINEINSRYSKKVTPQFRKHSLARINEDISLTIDSILNSIPSENYDAILLLNIESPFRTKMYMTKAINVMQIFDVDVVIGAILDDDIFYNHDGYGLRPWRNVEQTRLERDYVYKKVGGMTLFTRKFFKKYKKIIGGRVGHVVMDQKSSFTLKTRKDWDIAEVL